MKPVIALVGRPNVGKSTLFNRMTRSKDALVADLPGLTRDRKYGEGEYEDKAFIVIDTGGISGDEAGIDAVMTQQSLTAINEADLVMFVVDAQTGLTAADELITRTLRTRGKPTVLVVNKIDGLQPESAAAEFYALGMGEPLLTSAAHNRGVKSLLEHALEPFPFQEQSGEDEAKGIRIGIIGRPNVGKSTLVNRFLGEDRVVVFDQPGTTRDSVYIPYERFGQQYTLIDTAGVRRRKNVSEAVEKFSIVKTLQAIKDSHVVILVIDARDGIVDQDLHLLGFAINAGRSLVIAINKWDGMTQDDKQWVKSEIDRRFDFISYAKIHFISALHGTGVGNMYKTINECYQAATTKWSTNYLTTLMEDAVSQHPPPMVNGRRIKLRYAHQGGSNPPIVVVHGNQTDSLPKSYKRYLENTFRKVLGTVGTPIRFEFRSGSNPFAGRANPLSARQEKKKSRLMKHARKQKKKQKHR